MSSNQKILANYIDVHIELLAKKLTSTKRSILYDIKRRSDGENLNPALSTDRKLDESWKKKLGIKLPISDPKNFLTFDADINTNIEKRNAIKTMFEITTDGCFDYVKAIKLILAAIITKEVQLLYSGCGRKMKNIGKLNFSATHIFKVIEEFITDQYGNQNRTLKVLTTVSTYLSGAKD
ncbi:Protein of unknown function, partial [Cotesia congregata]